MTWQMAEVGSEAFNVELEALVKEIGQAVEATLGDNLVALVLGGGYGRGEGGVFLDGERELAYNDLDFTLLVHSKSQVDPDRLSAAMHSLEQRCGIDIDFSRPLTVEDVRHWPHWLMWHELLLGHIVVVGPNDILTANAPPALHQAPPLIEASRLLLNRGAGLLWSHLVAEGHQAAPDKDFVRRNVHKTWLGLGDSLLLMEGCHSTAYRERAGRYEELLIRSPDYAAIVPPQRYRDALSFRLSPHLFPSEISTEEIQQARTAWQAGFLLIESRRTGVEFADGPSYAAWTELREPEQNGPAQWPRNLVRNLQLGRCSLSYPRERLFRDILGEIANPTPDSSEAFLAIWRRFN